MKTLYLTAFKCDIGMAVVGGVRCKGLPQGVALSGKHYPVHIGLFGTLQLAQLPAVDHIQ